MKTEADVLNFSKKLKFTPQEFQDITKLISSHID
jgi:hypothetical protein